MSPPALPRADVGPPPPAQRSHPPDTTLVEPDEAREFLELTAAHRDRIEAALAHTLESGRARPAVLHDAMRYAALSGGKRLRPLLCVHAAELCGRALGDVLPTACALELIHAQSLIHDDLPAIDDDRVRRGREACHVRYGEAVAILAGDALLARAFELLAAQAAISAPDVVVEVVSLISRSIGRDGMAAGEVADVLAEGTTGDLPTLEFVHEHKSGDLLRASLLAGAVLGGAPPALRDRLSTYGGALGLAFQIVDDILGAVGDAGRLGKPTGRDAQRKKLTYPRLVGVARSREIAAEKAHEALAAVADLGPAARPLQLLARYVLQRNT